MKNLFLTIFIVIYTSSCKSVSTKKITENKFKNNYKFDSEINEMISKDSINPDYQLATTYFANKVDHKNALALWDQATKQKKKAYSKQQIDSINSELKPKFAKEYIIEQSRKNKIVIINETHHNISHRVFAESLLKDLFNNGYKNLCIEALSNGKKDKDSLLNDRKYATYSSGYYTENPQFGNLIRTALKIGYEVFPYETTQEEGGEKREIDQANNIKEIIETKPNEKFLIYCGIGHALEGNINFFGGQALAERINRLIGIDPLTVDQAFYSEKSKSEYNSLPLSAINIQKPSVLLNKKNEPFSYKKNDSWIDIVVFHPNTEYINGRPNWLINKNRKTVKIDIKNIKINFPVMVMAFVDDEDINEAIPFDIVEVNNKNELIAPLVLEKGNYNVIITNKEGEIIEFSKKVD